MAEKIQHQMTGTTPTREKWSMAFERTNALGDLLTFVPYSALKRFAVFVHEASWPRTIALYDGDDVQAACAAFGADVSGCF